MSLNSDTLSCILNKLDYYNMISLMGVSKFHNSEVWKMFSREYKKEAHIGKVKLRLLQWFAMQDIKIRFKQNNQLHFLAYPGYGKTIQSLYYAYHFCKQDPSNRVVITAPGKLLTRTWIPEMTKLEWYTSDAYPKCDKCKVEGGCIHKVKSKVLVLGSARQKHGDFSKSVDDIFEKHRICIRSYGLRENIQPKLKYNMLYIYDEAQHYEKNKSIYDDCLLSTSRLLLSADLNISLSNKLEIPSLWQSRQIPKVTFITHYMESNRAFDECIGSQSDHIWDFNNHFRDYAYLIDQFIEGHKKIVIISDQNGTIGDRIYKYIKNKLTIFKLLSSTNPIDKFLLCEDKSVLFVYYSSSEGVTINVGGDIPIIMIKPNILGTPRFRQLVNRFTRQDNPFKTINIHALIGGIYPLYKYHYMRCYSDIRWSFEFFESPNNYSISGFKKITSLIGVDMEELSNVDGCIVLDNKTGKYRYDKVIKWWREYKDPDTILNEKIIRDLYI